MLKLLLIITIIVYIRLIIYPNNKLLSNVFYFVLILFLLVGIFVIYSMTTDIINCDPIYELLLRLPVSNKTNTDVTYLDLIGETNPKIVQYDSTLADYYLKFKNNVFVI